MGTKPTAEVQAILDDMYYTAYQRLWDREIGRTATITVTRRIGSRDLVFRMYAAVRPLVKYDPATDRHDTGKLVVQLDYKAKLGRGGVVRAGYVVGTS